VLKVFQVGFAVAIISMGGMISYAQNAPTLVSNIGKNVDATRGGKAAEFTIESKILAEVRKVLVVLPSSYIESSSTRRYPVTVVTNGETMVQTVAVVCDELTRNGQIPESVIVGIENVGGNGFLAANNKRVYDLTPPGLSVSGSGLNGGGDRFLDFIEKELLPAVDRQFRTSSPRFLVGHSSGGILATYVAATRAVFSAVVSLDAPIHLGENWLAKKLIARAAEGKSAVRYASIEAVYGWPDPSWKTLTDTAPASWKIYREKLRAEGHESMQLLGAYIGLRVVFSDYSIFAAPKAPTTSILPHYKKFSESIGSEVIPPKQILRNVVDDFLMEGRGAAAREAYKTLVFGYGIPTDNAELLAHITEGERRAAPTETVEGLLSTPFPTPDEAKAFIGEWVGDVWMNAGEPRRGAQTLRITIKDGRVVAETVQRMPDGEIMIQPVQYMKVTPAGLTWGSMNGMRPRGVNLMEGALKDDTLTGKMRFGGIDFRLPDGSPPPSLHFSFRRVRK